MMRSLFLLLVGLGLLAGCGVPTPEPASLSPTPVVALATFTPTPTPSLPQASMASPVLPSPTPTPVPQTPFWQLIFPGAEVVEMNGLVALRQGAGLVAYGVLFDGDPDHAHTVGEWLEEDRRALAAVNCGFYWDHEGTLEHMGLLEVQGERLAPVRPHWGAALVVRNNRAQIVRQPRQGIAPMTLGVQGWPTLLWQGEVVADLDAGDVARRTAVGVDALERVVWVVDNRGSTLQGFARRLREDDLGLVNAVNLDGGASTGLQWRLTPGGERQGVESLPVPCVITFGPLS